MDVPHWRHRAPKAPSRRGAIIALTAALVLVTGAVSLLAANRPAQLAAAPVDIVVPNLSGADLNQWCRDRVAAGTTGLTSRAKNWLTDCIAVSNPLPTPSPSPTGTPTPTPTTPSPTPTTPSPTLTTPPPTTTVPPTTTPPVTTPPPSPTPTPTGVLTGCLADPGRCGYPDANSAGAHGTLAAYTGPTTITTAGTVISDVSINGCITLMAPNTTFRNVRISCSSGGYAVDTPHNGATGPAYSDGVNSFDHVTIVCTGHGGTAIGEARILAVGVDISGCENGFDLDDTITLADSYIHDLLLDSVAHSDGIQVWAGARNVVLRHNTFLVQGDTSALITGGNNPGLVIADNLLDGGAYTVYCSNNTGNLTNNRFGPIGPNHTAPWGHTTDCGNMTAGGNIEDTTGLPAPIG